MFIVLVWNFDSADLLQYKGSNHFPHTLYSEIVESMGLMGTAHLHALNSGYWEIDNTFYKVEWLT